MTQDIRRIFPEITDSSLPISKETLKLFNENENLRVVAAQLGYKIIIKFKEILEYFNDTPIEVVPKMKNLIRSSFFDINPLSFINEPSNLAKVEKFPEKV